MSLAVVSKDQPQPDATPTFEMFWTLWPRRCARRDAEKAWSQMSDADRVAALSGLVTWRSVWLARGELQFVPYPATWLRGARWEDELPEQWGASHASHVAAKLPETTHERAAIPAHVLATIQRLKGRP